MTDTWKMKMENPYLAEQPVEKKSPWKINLFNPFLSEDDIAPATKKETSLDKFETIFSRLIQAESRGKHTTPQGTLTTSPAGAQGITQLMPKTASDPGFGIDPVKDQSEAEYLRVGRSYLQAMVKSFDGDYEKALAAYNAGSTNVRKAISKATRAGDSTKWREHLPRGQETNPYIDKILKGL